MAFNVQKNEMARLCENMLFASWCCKNFDLENGIVVVSIPISHPNWNE